VIEQHEIGPMIKYLIRKCPHCQQQLAVEIRAPERNSVLRAINGSCASCGYRFAWLLVRGNAAVRKPSKDFAAGL